jgi:hypothetical protein
LGHGHLVVDYGRIFYAGSTNQTTNGVGKIETAKDLMDKMVGEINQVHNYAGKLNRKSYVVIYSIAYFIVLFAANTILFVLSLAFCRTMLREVESSGKKITTLSLAFTNLVFVVGCSCFLLFFITLAAIPVFWMIIPILYQISAESISTVVVGLIVGCFALLVIIGNSTKIVLFIALLPSVFALFVILFSILAMKWRNAFHFIIVNLFIRCSQKSPFIVLGSIILFVSAGICFAAKIIHILGFL